MQNCIKCCLHRQKRRNNTVSESFSQHEVIETSVTCSVHLPFLTGSCCAGQEAGLPSNSAVNLNCPVTTATILENERTQTCVEHKFNSHQAFNKLLDFRHSGFVVLVVMKTSLSIREVNHFGLEFSFPGYMN